MTVTLKPVLDALGYGDAAQQRAVVKLMVAAGVFGEVPVKGVLSDQQADAVLAHVTFDDAAHALQVVHEHTQAHMIRRPAGVERSECEEPAIFHEHREQLMQALQQAGMLDEVKPTQKYYDHVLVLGATEAEVDKRLDHLKELWDQGVRFGKIHLLGSQRALKAGDEPSNGIAGENGKASTTEMDMMENRYYAKAASWPKEMQAVRVLEVNTFNKADGSRANTKDTIEAWNDTHPAKGSVLVISSQPYVKYQEAAVKTVLSKDFDVETVGADAPRNLKISVAVDSIARQIDVGFAKLQERLKLRKPRLETQLVLIDPKDIKVDAATYQFRSGGDAKGVTEKGRIHTDRWDPVLHGDPIMVHERLDGRIFVADGHHRVDMATKLNAVGKGPGKMAAMVLREADGYTPEDVKIIAAYKNIAHGQTNVVDTAKVFKEAYGGKVHVEMLPHLQMDKGNLTMAFTMSKLSDKVLDAVAKGDVSAEMAENLAKRVPEDGRKQEEVLGFIKQKLQQSYRILPESRADTVNVQLPQQQLVSVEASGFAAKIRQERGAQASHGLAV